ncbi:MAG TPA: ubiquinol-cytochrome C chaperone family protein, partial [Brevundimonas sp.]|nr:ubiquinol-cytochrome C chaperone family protein [Brevundimonas sp.]
EAPLRAADADALAKALAKNVYESDEPERAGALARYAIASRARLATQSLADLTKAPDWAEITQ